jgi:hypothetical protein
MNEEGLREILHSCRKYDVPETRQRAEMALNSQSAIGSIRQSTNETLDWLAEASTSAGIDLFQFVRTPVWIIPNPLVGVYTGRTDNQDDIIVYEGTFQLLAFVVFLWESIARTKKLLDQSKVSPQEREHIENQIIQVMGLGVPLCARQVVSPTPLPDLRVALAPAETDEAAGQLVSAELFMLLHEQSHVDLGHTKGKSGQMVVRPQFAIPEKIDDYMADEFEADRCAVSAMPAKLQGAVAFGAIWFLLSVLYHETYLSRLNVKYPLAINRMKAIMDTFGSSMRDGDRYFAAVMIEDGQRTMESGKQFAEVPDAEKMYAMFRGASPNYAVDFIQWFFPYTNDFLLQRSA